MNVSDLRKMLGLPDFQADTDSNADVKSTTGSDDLNVQPTSINSISTSSSRHFRVRRQSMEQLDLIKVFFS